MAIRIVECTCCPECRLLWLTGEFGECPCCHKFRVVLLMTEAEHAELAADAPEDPEELKAGSPWPK